MEYRNVGKWGLKISEFSLGSWLTFGNELDISEARKCMKAAYDSGINFFDNAEAYAAGLSESIMGMILKEFKRESIVVSTKIFWGGNGPNDIGLSRKHLFEGAWNSLKRLQLDYVDLIYCHRPDPNTPLEETAMAMNDIVRSGMALYWGTSEWNAESLEKTFNICSEYRLVPPVVEQPQYSLLFRERVEKEYVPIIDRYGIGLTTWSPLASGVLTGKYNEGIPDGSRLARHTGLKKHLEESGLISESNISRVKKLQKIAKDLGTTSATLSLAWCLKNDSVSSVILGVSSVEQLTENLKALNLKERITDDVFDAINRIFPL